jgi:hypothetical protein
MELGAMICGLEVGGEVFQFSPGEVDLFSTSHVLLLIPDPAKEGVHAFVEIVSHYSEFRKLEIIFVALAV